MRAVTPRRSESDQILFELLQHRVERATSTSLPLLERLRPRRSQLVASSKKLSEVAQHGARLSELKSMYGKRRAYLQRRRRPTADSRSGGIKHRGRHGVDAHSGAGPIRTIRGAIQQLSARPRSLIGTKRSVGDKAAKLSSRAGPCSPPRDVARTNPSASSLFANQIEDLLYLVVPRGNAAHLSPPAEPARCDLCPSCVGSGGGRCVAQRARREPMPCCGGRNTSAA
jgi:hypothetical protein